MPRPLSGKYWVRHSVGVPFCFPLHLFTRYKDKRQRPTHVLCPPDQRLARPASALCRYETVLIRTRISQNNFEPFQG